MISPPSWQLKQWPLAKQGRIAAFSLVELLAVLAVLALMVGAATKVISQPSYGLLVYGAVDATATLAEQASRLARINRSPTRLALNVDPTSAHYAREAAIFLRRSDGTWRLQGTPLRLPQSIFFDVDHSTGSAPGRADFKQGTLLDGSSGTLTAYYEFDRNGHFAAFNASDASRVVLTPGVLEGGANRRITVTPPFEKHRDGFIFRRYGVVTRFDAIPPLAGATP